MRQFPHAATAILGAATLLWACGDSTSPVLELVQNGGFETGDFTGWTVSNLGSGQFMVTSDTVLTGMPFVILPPPESLFAAVTVQTGPSSQILYQDIALPAGKRIRFRATVYVQTSASDWIIGDSLDHVSAGNQQFRVDVMNVSAGERHCGAGVLMNVYQTKPGDPLKSAYISLDVDLTPFAGQTVRIRFAEVDNSLWLAAGVDRVSVTAR